MCCPAIESSSDYPVSSCFTGSIPTVISVPRGFQKAFFPFARSPSLGLLTGPTLDLLNGPAVPEPGYHCSPLPTIYQKSIDLSHAVPFQCHDHFLLWDDCVRLFYVRAEAAGKLCGARTPGWFLDLS